MQRTRQKAGVLLETSSCSMQIYINHTLGYAHYVIAEMMCLSLFCICNVKNDKTKSCFR